MRTARWTSDWKRTTEETYGAFLFGLLLERFAITAFPAGVVGFREQLALVRHPRRQQLITWHDNPSREGKDLV